MDAARCLSREPGNDGPAEDSGRARARSDMTKETAKREKGRREGERNTQSPTEVSRASQTGAGAASIACSMLDEGTEDVIVKYESRGSSRATQVKGQRSGAER